MKLLFRAFFISMLTSFITMLILAYALGREDFDSRVIPLIFIGSVFVNLVLTVLMIPAKFAADNYGDPKQKLFAYLVLPLLIFVCLLFNLMNLQEGDYQFYLISVGVFIVVHTWLFRKALPVIEK
jgi:hypothetical protein